MHRVDTPSGLFVDGTEPNTGTPLVSSEANAWQEELCNVVEDDGVSLDPNNDHQVSQRITARIATHAALDVVSDDAHGYVMPFAETYGCMLSDDVFANTHNMGISAGRRCSDDGTVNMVLASAMIKDIDAAWAAGTNQGGLDTGSVAANTWYHVFLIKNPTSGVVDVLISTSVATPAMPSGYTKKRLLESRLTNGSADLINVIQWGDEMMWENPPLDIDNVSINYSSSSLLTLSTPAGREVKAVCNITIYPGANTRSLYLSPPDVDDEEAATTVAPLASIMNMGQTADDRIGVKVEMKTNSSSQIRARAGSAAVTIRLVTLGWKSFRGRNI